MPSDIDISLGALLVEGLVAMAIWGVTCVQGYTYFNQSSSDRLLLKGTITFLLVLTTFDGALIGHFLYFFLIKQFGNPLILTTWVWSLSVHGAIRPIVGFIIRTMFAHRIYIFSNKSILLTSWIMVLSSTGFAIALFFDIKNIEFFTGYQEGLVYLNIAAVTLANLSITASLCYLLHKSRTGFRRTNSVIRLLMMYTINTGGLVTVGSLLDLVDLVVYPQGPGDIVDSLSYILNGMYLSSYLASLNAREDIRDRFNDPVSVRSQLGLPMAFAPGSIQSSLQR